MSERKPNLTKEQFDELCLTLENEGEFYRKYVEVSSTLGTHRDARDVIYDALRQVRGVQPFFRQADVFARELLRRYFDDRWGVTWSGQNACADVVPPWDKPPQLPVHVPGCPIPIPSPEYHAEWLASQPQPQPQSEPTMAAPIVITTKTLVNDQDVAKMSDSEIYNLISNQEAEIKALEAIEAKPKRLVAEIEKRKAGIAALVAHLDTKVD